MIRESKAVKEKRALEEFEQALRSLPDPRRAQGKRYSLRAVVVIALMAMVCGADDAEAIQEWGEANSEWLSTFVELPHGTPTQDVILAVFAALEPQAFSGVFLSWMAFLRARLDLNGGHIAIDGKTSRGSYDRAHERPAVHTVSAWLSDESLVLGQQKTQEKSNEITAIPQLLALLDIGGATVTIDAMGCQTDIAEVITKAQGHYILAVKDNQPTLHEEIQEAFADALDAGPRPLDQSRLTIETYTSTDKGHGRIEERTLHVCRDLSWISTASRWSGLEFIAMVESVRTDLSKGTTSTQARYYIGSDAKASTESIANLIRRHWSIENELHWVLDIAFSEDSARHRAGNCAQNFATLRHFAINLLKSDRTVKLGVANKRKRAGWNRKYLIHLLTGAEC